MFIAILAVVAITEPAIVSSVVKDSALPFLTSAERAHMADVHDVVRCAMLLAVLAVTALVLLGTTRGITKRHATGAALITVAMLLLLIPFSWTFTAFHEAFFPGGNWQFPADSWLITHFPPSFFMTAAISIVGGAAVLLASLSWLLSRKD